MDKNIGQKESIPWHQMRLLDDIDLEYRFEKKKRCALILRKGETTFDLLSILPPDHHFFDSGSWGYEDELKRIHIRLQSIKEDPREFFAVLHEIGHVVLDHRKGAEYVAQTKQRPKRTRDYEVTYSDFTITDERNAWAEAIQIARTLRKQGFDLFKLFENSNNLMGWLRSTGLETYEKNSRARVSKKWLIELFEKEKSGHGHKNTP